MDGNFNTASGYEALWTSQGSYNTGTGSETLIQNQGSFNTATGSQALYNNETGFDNTASGVDALMSNTTGAQNTATGVNTLVSNATGIANTATGLQALDSNTTGSLNTATGFDAMESNTTGRNETATGANALFKNTIGQNNTAVGMNVLFNNTTGSNNIALGTNAGTNLTTGGNNIDIGSAGVAAESKSIRLGTQGAQTTTFIAGISGSPVSGTAVVVSTSGKLGIVGSSARFKRNIRDMGSSSSGLLKLRPVTFSYKNDPTDTLQYGLVAEEVARVYPELVSYGADGKVETVNYLTLNTMLLNELQKQYNINQSQAQQLKGQAELIKSLGAQLSEVRTSARQQVVELKASQERNLVMVNERLSALEHAGTLRPATMMRFNRQLKKTRRFDIVDCPRNRGLNCSGTWESLTPMEIP